MKYNKSTLQHANLHPTYTCMNERHSLVVKCVHCAAVWTLGELRGDVMWSCVFSAPSDQRLSCSERMAWSCFRGEGGKKKSMNEVLEPAEKVRFQMLHSLRRMEACDVAFSAPKLQALLSISARFHIESVRLCTYTRSEQQIGWRSTLD